MTIALLKRGLSREDALKEPEDAEGFIVRSVDPEEHSLFVAGTDPHPPWWVDFLDPHVDGELEDLVTASSSAVLLVESAGRLFAVTFGQGRHLLDLDAMEQDFGLKVVLNTVEPDQLKSVDAKTVDETTLHTRREVSRDSTFTAFGLDVTRDILRAVTGSPPDERLARRLTGSDVLALNTRTQVADLRDLCGQLLSSYRSKAYRANFDFIDYLRPEKRVGQIRNLEQGLLAALASRDIDDVHLACPEPMEWVDIEGFRYTGSDGDDDPDPDPRITAYLDLQDDEPTIKKLKADRVIAISGNGDMLRSWPVFRCLVYQTELDGDLYVLSTGDWFKVSLDFKDKVYTYVNQLPRTQLDLPAARRNTDEDKYNKELAESINGLLLDKELVYDGPDKMEICDVLTDDSVLVHVKQRGSSSTLSHLFSQGLNCAERLLEDPDFRTRARAVVKGLDASFTDALPKDQPAPQSIEVAFVVLTRSRRSTPLTLPFFSVVGLRSAAMRLRALGFNVSVRVVEVPR